MELDARPTTSVYVTGIDFPGMFMFVLGSNKKGIKQVPSVTHIFVVQAFDSCAKLFGIFKVETIG